MSPKHFRNFLGPPGSSLCGGALPANAALTLNPADVTCERCLSLLGRLREAKIGAPSGTKQKPEP